LFHLQIHRVRALHADPHPGNYLIDATGSVGLVDFGCVKKFSPAFIEIMRAFEGRVWLQGEEHCDRMARLIWGPAILKKARLARELLKRAVHFYGMLFPGLAGGGRVVDFGDPKILNAMFRIFNDNVRNKTVNPEFAFYARAEMGLYNLLHLLRAKVDTSAILEKFDANARSRRECSEEL
jgi:predicted unusual protein kinase regulating ubiquinone biosynthesis (AarF/ABC1/UbiB family)